MNRNKKFWALKIIGCIVCVALLVALFGYVVMILWNNVLAAVVPVAMVSFWQALGLLILAKIFFGGFHGGRGGCRGGGPGSWRKQWKEKWEEKLQHMSPEEREKIKEEWRNRCSGWGRPGKEAE